jgi:HSP20 family protein
MSAFREALQELPDAVFVDVLEGEDGYLVVLDLPGATSDTVELTAEHGLIHVDASCETPVPTEFEAVVEDRPHEIDVELPVPMDGSPEHATAELSNGVLELTIPKEERTTETTIPVSE